jgi:hypothetical protein
MSLIIRLIGYGGTTYDAINQRLDAATNSSQAKVILQQIGNEIKAGTFP